jgi:hypothetical protein
VRAEAQNPICKNTPSAKISTCKNPIWNFWVYPSAIFKIKIIAFPLLIHNRNSACQDDFKRINFGFVGQGLTRFV